METPDDCSQHSDENESLPPVPSKKYVINQHPNNGFKSLLAMRSEQKFCDIELEVDGHTLSAHKVVLAATSPYFCAMFSAEMSEKNKSKIVLHGITRDAFQLLVDYAYTGEVTISDENVRNLLPAACLWQIMDVQDVCCEFLIEQLNPFNCFGVRSLADSHSCEGLHEASDQYIVDHFTDVMLSDEFLELPYEAVEHLLSRSTHHLYYEQDVYNAVIKWIKHDVESRESFFPLLMALVKLQLLPRKFFCETVSREKLIESYPACIESLMEGMRYHVSPDYRAELNNDPATDFHNRLKSFIFTVGNAVDGNCEYYNPDSNTWSAFAGTKLVREFSGITACDRYVYAIGGQKNGLRSSGEFYDPIKNAWRSIRCMSTKRSAFGIASLDGMIYVCGGWTGDSGSNLAEKYDPLVDSWTPIAAMDTKRCGGQLVALGGSLYAIGGYHLEKTDCQPSMERFDPREGKWYSMPPMTIKRIYFGADALNGQIYIAGGFNNISNLKAAERFDPIVRQWFLVLNMNEEHRRFDLVSSGVFLYAVGGRDSKTVEMYYPGTDIWMMANPLINSYESLGATALECPDPESVISPS